jgi:5-methylcytosine-specific restriction protein B
VSQGGDFTAQEILESIEEHLVYVHGKTRAKAGASSSQGEDFVNAAVGDYFYLTHGNRGIYLIGQFSGPPNVFSSYEEGWVDRPFRFICAATDIKPYSGPHKRWAPNDNSTFTRVPDDELALFEEQVLGPHFGIRLSQFGINSSGDADA